MWFNNHHIASGEISQNCQTGQLSLSGLHSDHLGKARQSNLFKFDILDKRPDDTYLARWSYGNATPKDSSFFPEQWTPSKIFEKILEAIKNPVEDPVFKNGRWSINGATTENMIIKIILEANPLTKNPTGKIITAYPTWK